MLNREACPCGSGRHYNACCQPYLTGELSAPTAEALMRSRYSAFVALNWAYLDCTQVHRDSCPHTLDLVWQGLEVLATQGGGTEDMEGTVEFIARYSHQDCHASLHEISRFHKMGGKWLYVDGTFPLKEKN